MKTLFVIVGPTGVGKTSLCLKVAEHLNTVIINADSRQVFKEIPVGTAAPTKDERKSIRHFFVGNLHINEYYNASKYEQDVLKLLNILFKYKDNVIMSGGSMMYVDAVCKGIDDIPSVDDNIRKTLQERFDKEGLSGISKELALLDPDYYAIVDKNNHKRIIHALEICLSTGKPYSSFRKNTTKERPFRIIKIGLNMDRQRLYERIDLRVEQMIHDGLIQEALNVYEYKNLNALNTVGYKETFEYLDGLCTLDNAIFRIKSNTHKYCRKQLTWFRRDPNIHWFSPDNIEEIINYINTFI
ncbi:MAG: tRNA (adenosine(37)-N6)-dimethylallyltransferase MiaA [Prevotella sp.]|jgi:tRNA dimethylallyltransferase|uniref:tRNA dimethylallyltransferase n=1 Tax=Xylanibacter rarus TaxID=1676614 RepID=A0A8E1UR10_9BACT|nr:MULTISPECIES: tRNA (adenosine(37)-N6)-dimethylallyltransferase MiaA [Prevotellaceae]KOO68524.1 tRNA delta(2)-isopentenylpyrophosphate transferase [Xylanibacter rarus]MBS5875640.1 tRNA (adenosine(37)-N6)-dimethylallyltransferase MiaA [Prevotella sp.]